MNTVILDGGWTNYGISEDRLGNEAGRVRDLMLEVQAEQSGFILRVKKEQQMKARIADRLAKQTTCGLFFCGLGGCLKSPL